MHEVWEQDNTYQKQAGGLEEMTRQLNFTSQVENIRLNREGGREF